MDAVKRDVAADVYPPQPRSAADAPGVFHKTLVTSPPAIHLDINNRPPSSQPYPHSPAPSSSSFHLSPLQPPQAAAGFLPAPHSHALSPYGSSVSPANLNPDWHDADAQPPADVNPLVRVDSAPQHYSHTPVPSPLPLPSPADSSTMSSVAMQQQYEPRFMGPRPAFTWPGILGSSPQMLGHDLSAYGSDATSSVSPPDASRAGTESPPRPLLTAEQRELKRQRDQFRRDAKHAARARRADSSSSAYGMHSPPATAMGAGDMAHQQQQHPPPHSSPTSASPYSAASTMSIMSEPVTSMAPQQPYMPMAEHQHGLYTPPYSAALPSAPYMPSLSYSSSYPPPLATPTSQYGPPRPMLAGPHGDGLMYKPQTAVVGAPAHVRVVHTRPKPQCWEHGCNGRQFSTFSNLLRHQREKSGQAAKATCPNCGAEFTRTTARNGHLLHDKCKSRRNS